MNNKKIFGFTLMEIMVATSILTIGLMPILQSLSTALNAFGGYEDVLNAAPWADEQIAQKQQELMTSGTLSVGQTQGTQAIGRKTYEWLMSVDAISLSEGLYKVNMDVSWANGSKTKHLSRTAYVLQPIQYQKTTGSTVP